MFSESLTLPFSCRRGIRIKSGYLWIDAWMKKQKERRDRRKEKEKKGGGPSQVNC